MSASHRWFAQKSTPFPGSGRQNRRLSQDYERLCETEEAWIYAAMTRIMLKPLAGPSFSDSFLKEFVCILLNTFHDKHTAGEEKIFAQLRNDRISNQHNPLSRPYQIAAVDMTFPECEKGFLILGKSGQPSPG